MGKTTKSWYSFDGWGAPNPDASKLSDAIWRAVHSTPTRADLLLLISAVGAYRHFAGHPATTRSIVAQLRQLRRRVACERKAASHG